MTDRLDIELLLGPPEFVGGQMGGGGWSLKDAQ